MDYNLSRFKLAEIAYAYERYRQFPDIQEIIESAKEQLQRINLPLGVSRFQLNERTAEIERRLER